MVRDATSGHMLCAEVVMDLSPSLSEPRSLNRGIIERVWVHAGVVVAA